MIRVFPRRTKATPDDEDVRIGLPGLFDETDEVRISVAFTWDIPRAERLAVEWARVAPTSLGGPAFNNPGGDFEPGLYLKKGHLITSRGCPNRCWFCSVWRREGREVHELPIRNGWNVLDDNLLACSEDHIRNVFMMLKNQPERAHFTGGLEAARLKDWHIDLFSDLRPKQMFFAYDTPDDLEPLREAGKRLLKVFTKTSRNLRCYVLIGYPKDTMEAAEMRLRQSVRAGFFPMAMLWRDEKGQTSQSWRQFQRVWSRPAITQAML